MMGGSSGSTRSAPEARSGLRPAGDDPGREWTPPGPWEWWDDGTSLVRITDVAEQKLVCETVLPSTARLIAAAPELYADAEFLCARVRELEGSLTDDSEVSREFFGHVIPALARMESALAKARGEQ
jgi:hypothetical protein